MDVVGWIAALLDDRIFLLPVFIVGLLLIADAIWPGTWPGSDDR